MKHDIKIKHAPVKVKTSVLTKLIDFLEPEASETSGSDSGSDDSLPDLVDDSSDGGPNQNSDSESISDSDEGPSTSKAPLPEKKMVGNLEAGFVEERRQALEYVTPTCPMERARVFVFVTGHLTSYPFCLC